MASPQTPTIMCNDGHRRCFWCAGDPIYEAYHDTEWGRPQHDDYKIFEKICLEGFQAGLSWITVLRKREAFRAAFKDFDPEKMSQFGKRDIERLMLNSGIIRNRQKIEAAISNAKVMLDLIDSDVSLGEVFWSHAPKKPPKAPRRIGDHVAITPESINLSKDLARRGFKFVGPTTMYAAMQSLGLVNDHFQTCDFR
jgi:DNA-3-methyladenine glycosylase I